MVSLLKNHNAFLFLFFIFLIIKLFSLFVVADVWWDSAVYLGMGKYIYSLGEIGLWEDSRPLIWPLILGFFWKIGLDAIFFGKLLVVLFSLGILTITYLIALDVFNKKVAIISALFLAFSQTFFLFSNILHAEIPSTFFILLGFYCFLRKKYSLSGLFLGIAFMARFFQLFAFIPLALILFYLFIRKKMSYKGLFYFSLFFLIPTIPYFILNQFLYGNILHPFLLQSFMTKYTGWVFYQPFYFYFVSLVKENVLVLFSIIALVFIFKRPSLKSFSLALLFLFLFVPYNLVAHKEMRLLIPALPFLYILTGYGLFYFINAFKKNKNLLLSLLLVIFLVLSIPNVKFDKYEDNLDLFYNYMNNEEIKDGLWISNPSFIAYSNKKAELIYYPLYNSEKIDDLATDLNNANRVLINTCDIPCPPYDLSCEQKHMGFLNLLKKEFMLILQEKHGSCEYYIFGQN
ncbi:glycosyltransferase family 39 protein [Candidatus Woesearchaeota archaeon]|nr:glycosyltransferase family 39 protein [Candidatus Woesearchaeota archaeon]